MTTSFTLTSSHKSFTDKQKCLFDLLENAEKASSLKKTQAPTKEKEDAKEENMHVDTRRECGSTHSRNQPRKRHMNQYKSRESIFKRPEAPISRCLPTGRVPGFRKNPNKWTKYTLEDVKDEDMSDRSNMQAALSFLKTIEKEKSDNDEDDDNDKMETLPHKIVFKKTSIVKKKEDSLPSPVSEANEEKASFRSSKVVMPEYVVGQSIKRDTKKKIKRSAEAGKLPSSKQLKLDHLDDIEDNDEVE